MVGWVRMIVSRVLGWLSPRRKDDEFAKELESHLDLLTAENIRRGMAPEEARRAAHVQLGGMAQIRERHREMHTLPFLETLFRDVRWASARIRRYLRWSMPCC